MKPISTIIVNLIISFFIIAGGSFLLDRIGIPIIRIGQTNDRTVTVSGFAKTQQNTQVASFYVGVYSVGDDKEKAITEVNSKIEGVIKTAKDFGIKDTDIKTQNMSVYQQEEPYIENTRQKTRKGQWRADNNISITLREVDKATELSAALFKTGANSVSGPNFAVDDTNDSETALIDEAIKNAKTKAEQIAKASGRKLGKVMRVEEAGTSSVYPMYDRAASSGIGGAPMEPGTSTITKTLTVTFGLK